MQSALVRKQCLLLLLESLGPNPENLIVWGGRCCVCVFISGLCKAVPATLQETVQLALTAKGKKTFEVAALLFFYPLLLFFCSSIIAFVV